MGTPTAFAGASDHVAVAQAAIGELTAALVGATPVPGGAPAAAVPECDGIHAADQLADEQGDVVEQAYSVSGAGVVGRIVVFTKKKDAKRYFKNVTSDVARDCITSTIGANVGGEGEQYLERGTLPGIKGSITFDGTITFDAVVIEEHEAYARKGAVVIQTTIGGAAGTTSSLLAPVQAWIGETARSF